MTNTDDYETRLSRRLHAPMRASQLARLDARVATAIAAAPDQRRRSGLGSVSRRGALLVFVMAGVIGTSFAAGATDFGRSATDTPLDATETITQSAGGRAFVEITEERSDRSDAAICVETQNGQACTVRSATEPMLYSGTDGQGGILLVVVDPQRRLVGVDITDADGTRRVLSLDGGLSVIVTAVGAARSASAIGQEGEVLATFDTGRLEMHRAQAQDAVDEQPDH